MIAERKRTVFAVVVNYGLFTTLLVIVVCFLVRPEVDAEVLRAPELDDVSAFGENETSRVDAWLKDQITLAKYPSLNIAVVRDIVAREADTNPLVLR